MPTNTHSAFTLSDAHAAAESRGYRPSRLGDRQRFNFSSAACHGGDNAAGCWARQVDGRVYFHCHKHGGNKADRLGNATPDHREPGIAGVPLIVKRGYYPAERLYLGLI